MATLTPVLFDHTSGAAFYLGFDLFLVRAPLKDGHIVTEESVSVRIPYGFSAADARNAAIRLSLLKAQTGSGWESLVAEAEAEAQRAAEYAGLTTPPALDDTEIVATALR